MVRASTIRVWDENGTELRGAARDLALVEYRTTGGIANAYLSDPSWASTPEDWERLSEAGPSLDEIEWDIPVSGDERDLAAIRDLAIQDQAGGSDDSFARTGDARDTIVRWYTAAKVAGDESLASVIRRLGVDRAADAYRAARAPA